MALERSGHNCFLAQPGKDSLDLTWAGEARAAARAAHWSHKQVVEEFRRIRTRRPIRLSLPSIVARYIEFVDPILRSTAECGTNATNLGYALDEAIATVFDDSVIEFLGAKGYTIEDVVSWAWILTSKRTLTAAARCAILEKHNSVDGGDGAISCLPPFILTFTLRRQHIDRESLRVLLWLSARTLGKDPYNPTSDDCGKSTLLSSGDSKTTMILFVRLIRAAAKVLPTALLYIAELFASVFSPARLAEVSEHRKQNHIRSYTKLYNKCLSLLARPCAIDPYNSVAVQHRAIFHLLREMTQFKPVLIVTREGYQAIIRVQTARGKTPAEREWAGFKAESWPPWKEEKLGIDAERGNEGKSSKTMQAIRHMMEAGYAMTVWERAATIVGGWDLDRTPTIQTRTLLPRPSLFPMRRLVPGLSGSQALSVFSDPVIWQARIRATRTLKEAWACFLACREYGVKPDKYVYFEMMQKLVFGHFNVGSDSPDGPRTDEVFPGDGKEVWPEPTSPRDVIYVKSDPPTPEEFLRQMIRENVRASKSMLVLVLKYTVSLNAGHACLWHSELTEPQIRSLVYIGNDRFPYRKQLLREVPDNVFAAFIGFLCRFSQPKKKDRATSWKSSFPVLFPTQGRPGKRYDPDSSLVSARGLSHATFLMRLRMPRYLPAWYSFISALQRRRMFRRPILPVPLQRVFGWKEIMQVLQWMKGIGLQVDIRGFELLCQELARTLQAYAEHEELTERAFWAMQGFAPNTSPEHPWSNLREMFKSSIRSLDNQFYQMVSPWGHSPLILDNIIKPPKRYLPSVPALVPSPHTLHSFIRVLGYANDRERLMKLLRWMKQAEGDLQVAMENRSSGRLRMRLCVVAFRVFLQRFNDESLRTIQERCIRTSEEGEEWDVPHSDPALREAYEIVQSSELMSPWPTMDEVYEYRKEMSSDIPLY